MHDEDEGEERDMGIRAMEVAISAVGIALILAMLVLTVVAFTIEDTGSLNLLAEPW